MDRDHRTPVAVMVRSDDFECVVCQRPGAGAAIVLMGEAAVCIWCQLDLLRAQYGAALELGVCAMCGTAGGRHADECCWSLAG